MLKELGVEKQQHPFYAHWVRQFFNQFQGNRRSIDLGRTKINAFLQRLTNDPSAADWQVKQAQDALEIYYEQFRGIALDPSQATEPHVQQVAPPATEELATDTNPLSRWSGMDRPTATNF